MLGPSRPRESARGWIETCEQLLHNLFEPNPRATDKLQYVLDSVFANGRGRTAILLLKRIRQRERRSRIRIVLRILHLTSS